MASPLLPSSTASFVSEEMMEAQTLREREHSLIQQIFVYSQALQFPQVSQPAK